MSSARSFETMILAQDRISALAVGAFLAPDGEGPLDGDDPRLVYPARRTGAAGYALFEALASRIAAFAGLAEGRAVAGAHAILVDQIDLDELSPVWEGTPWSAVVAMLVLAFPEVRWHFLDVADSDGSDDRKKCLKGEHGLAAFLAGRRRDPLFDSTGLRSWIRERTNFALARMEDDLRIPVRREKAAAIDEESAYCYFHALAAYRFGYRAEVVQTWEAMRATFGRTASHGFAILLEDMSLGFPDKDDKIHLLKLSERAKEDRCPSLDSMNGAVETSTHRILVTTGQQHPGDTTLRENVRYLANKASGRGNVVYKPAGGIFALWRDARLLTSKGPAGRAGNAPGFLWPPEPAVPRRGEGGHGTPGLLLTVAAAMLRRAESLAKGVQHMEDAVVGAVLATDALELTGLRTPTTATHALSLKHQFEVMAECQFSGVEFHIDVAPRLREIADDARCVARWFHRDGRENARLNAEMNVVHGIVSVFRDHFQFEEEHACVHRARHLHNRLWARQRWYRVAMLPLLWYLELLLSSFAVFVGVILLWVGLLALLFGVAGDLGAGYALSDAVSAFFSVGSPLQHAGNALSPGAGPGKAYLAVACLAIVSGFVHLGVFVSHLYSIVSRR